MTTEEINRAATLALTAEKAALTAEVMIRHGRLDEAQESASSAAQAAGHARLTLEKAGATSTSVPSSPIPLHLLDTPEVRQLLDALEAALPLAERVDRVRGRAAAVPIGRTAGMDVAESLGQLIVRLSLEVHGPAASVTGGRE